MRGKWILFREELATTPQTRQGWSPDLRPKSDFFKQDFHYENNILWKFQIDASHLACAILKNIKGKWILFREELATTPQTRQGWSPDLRPKSDFFKQDCHYENNILWKFQIDASHLGCFILKNTKGKWILLRGELARIPQTWLEFIAWH
jgi:hypothetical protein